MKYGQYIGQSTKYDLVFKLAVLSPESCQLLKLVFDNRYRLSQVR